MSRGGLAATSFRPEAFPVTFSARRASDHTVVWSRIVEQPDDGTLTALRIPPLAREHGPIEVRIVTATDIDSGWQSA